MCRWPPASRVIRVRRTSAVRVAGERRLLLRRRCTRAAQSVPAATAREGCHKSRAAAPAGVERQNHHTATLAPVRVAGRRALAHAAARVRQCGRVEHALSHARALHQPTQAMATLARVSMPRVAKGSATRACTACKTRESTGALQREDPYNAEIADAPVAIVHLDRSFCTQRAAFLVRG